MATIHNSSYLILIACDYNDGRLAYKIEGKHESLHVVFND